MQTKSYRQSLGFPSLDRREVVGRFDGGAITSDGGGVLLREAEHRLTLLDRFAACFRDYRTPWAIEFTACELVAQHVMALAQGVIRLSSREKTTVPMRPVAKHRAMSWRR